MSLMPAAANSPLPEFGAADADRAGLDLAARHQRALVGLGVRPQPDAGIVRRCLHPPDIGVEARAFDEDGGRAEGGEGRHGGHDTRPARSPVAEVTLEGSAGGAAGVTTWPFTPRQIDQILRDTYPIWGGGLSLDAYTNFQVGQRRTVWGGSHIERVALLDGSRLLASAKRYDLTARVDGRIRRVLGIGALFTTRELRGRGAAQPSSHIWWMPPTPIYEFALLFSDIGPSLYERLDFVPVPLESATITVKPFTGAPATLVRAGDDKDFGHITELSAKRASKAVSRLDRSEDYIRYAVSKRRLLAGLGPAGDAAGGVPRGGGRPHGRGVSRVQRAQRQWTIEEAGDRDPPAPAWARCCSDAGPRALGRAAAHHRPLATP
jgi:hypothetical protein